MADTSRGRLVGQGAAVGTARVFSLVVAAVQLPILTRSMAPDQYALCASAIALAMYFNLVGAEPTTLAFMRNPGTREVTRNYSFALASCFLSVTVLWVVALMVGLAASEVLLAAAIGAWGFGLAMSRIVSAAWLAWGQTWRYTWNLVASTGVRTALLVGLVLAGVDPVLSLCVAGVGSAIAAVSLGPRFSCRSGLFRLPPWSYGFGLGLAVASVMYTFLQNSGLLILQFHHDPAVGSYAAINQIAALGPSAVIGLMMTVAYPRMRMRWDSGDHAYVVGQLRQVGMAAFAVAGGAVAALIALDGAAVVLMVGPGYSDVHLVVPLVLSSAFAASGQTGVWLMQFRMQAKGVAMRSTAAGLFGGGVIVALALHFGAQGAALGTALGFVLFSIAMRLGLGLWTPVDAAVQTVTAAIAIWASATAASWEAVGVAAGLLVVVGIVVLARRGSVVRGIA